eukprot:466992-Rhodomonas_salina.1
MGIGILGRKLQHTNLSQGSAISSYNKYPQDNGEFGHELRSFGQRNVEVSSLMPHNQAVYGSKLFPLWSLHPGNWSKDPF